MNATGDTIEIRSGVVKPIECLKAGLELIRNQYWLFVGITFVGIIIATAVPFGILMGPMLCGIYLSLFKQRRGQLVEFNDLFKGFDYFRESLIAALLNMVPAFLIVIPTYISFYISLFAMIGATSGQPDPALVLGFFGFWGIIFIVMMVLMILISVVFTFTFPLIVERRLSGVDAVKLSMKAAKANFGGLLGLVLLNTLLGFAGVLLCYVGAILILPINFGALALAYEQVFGLSDAQPDLSAPPSAV